MGIMADGAAFAHGVMFENEWALLGGMALGAGFGLVLYTGSAALDGVALVRVVAFGATHFAGHHGMAMREAELTAFVEMALETGLRRFAWVYDRAFASTGLHVFATRTVTTFAAEAFG